MAKSPNKAIKYVQQAAPDVQQVGRRLWRRYAGQVMKHGVFIISLFLSGCASYKIETSSSFDFSKIKDDNREKIEVIKLNDYPQGGQCFEPMLFVLTLGLIPTHCVDDYEVKVGSVSVGEAKATYMSGWIPLFLPIHPKWKYGGNPNISEDLVQKIENQ